MIQDLTKGSGEEATIGRTVTVHYTGWLFHPTNDAHKGREFDSSHRRNEPFPFKLGAGEVIPGWDQGIEGMKVGGRRQLTIPPDLAYGEQGSSPDIKGGETLIFVVDLLSAQ